MKFFLNLIFTVLLFPSLASSAGKGVNLRLCIWEGYAPDISVKKFEKSMSKKHGFPVTVDVEYATDTDHLYEVIRTNKADVISIAHSLIKAEKYSYIDRNLVLPLPIESMSNYSKLLATLKNADEAASGGKIYGVPIAHGPYGLAYNSKLMTAPKSWKDLLDPQFKGKFSISEDQYEANVYIAALAAGVDRKDIFNLEKVATDKVRKNLRYLAKHARNLWEAVDNVSDLKGLSLAASWGDSLGGLNQIGEPWKFAEPKEGTTGWVDFLLINAQVKKDKRREKIAVEWLNYSIGNHFQKEVIVRSIGNDPSNSSLAKELSPALAKRHHLDDPSYFKNHRILWQTLDVRTQNGFKLMWERALASRPQ